MYVLCSDPGTPREHVQRNALAEEDVSGLSTDGCDMFDRSERLAFLQVPFDSTTRRKSYQPYIPSHAVSIILKMTEVGKDKTGAVLTRNLTV